MADSKFQGPSVGKDADPGKVMKLAMRVQKALTDLVVGEPKQLDPRSVLVAPLNHRIISRQGRQALVQACDKPS